MAPHFKSSRKLIITEWKDNAKSTSFFKSSSISWITKQCFWALFWVNTNFLVLYSIYCFKRWAILFLSTISSCNSSIVPIFYSPSVSSVSRMKLPHATFTCESEFISPPYFLASFNSTTPNGSPFKPCDMSIKIGLRGVSLSIMG